MEVTRETFKGSRASTQNLILFDSINALHDKLDIFNDSCALNHKDIDDRIKKSGRTNKFISGGSGLFGGWLAVITSKLFGI